MLLIPGSLIATLTFPGVIVHEVTHRFFCDLARVPVFDVCYFRVDKQAGYVRHGEPGRLSASFLIAIGPLILNTVLCAVISFAPIIALNLDSEGTPVVFFILGWLGISIGMHAFPSGHDMRNFSDAVHASRGRGLLYVVAKGCEALIRLANALRIVWFDLIYAVAVAWIAPGLIALFAQHAATH
jgi:hypothetical protein